MLLTGSQPATCGNDVGDFLLLKSIKNKMDYCDRHEMEVRGRGGGREWEVGGGRGREGGTDGGRQGGERFGG